MLGIANATQALDWLDADERAMQNIGRQGQTNIISESGLYALVVRSNKPEAKAFRKWVTGTALPTIRKTGSYVAGEEAFNVTTDAGLAAATAHILTVLQAKADSFKAQYEAAKPKAEAFKVIEEASGSITVTEAAKALKAKRTDLYVFLEHQKWVTRGKRRQATAGALRRGYMTTQTPHRPTGARSYNPCCDP